MRDNSLIYTTHTVVAGKSINGHTQGKKRPLFSGHIMTSLEFWPKSEIQDRVASPTHPWTHAWTQGTVLASKAVQWLRVCGVSTKAHFYRQRSWFWCAPVCRWKHSCFRGGYVGFMASSHDLCRLSCVSWTFVLVTLTSAELSIFKFRGSKIHPSISPPLFRSAGEVSEFQFEIRFGFCFVFIGQERDVWTTALSGPSPSGPPLLAHNSSCEERDGVGNRAVWSTGPRQL